MNNFVVKKTNNSRYPFIIYSTSYISPLENINEIESNIGNYTGKVLFDLLLSNGNAFNRFIEAFFDGNKFDINSFEVVKDVENDLKRESLKFYQENSNLLKNSVLSNIKKFKVKKGKVF